jgi:CBS domain-containing protein
MLLKEILSAKGSKVFTVSADATLSDVVQQLVEHNIGSLVVCDGDVIVGIITERDILRAVREHRQDWAEVVVRARMTQRLISGSPEDDINKIMGLMTELRIRHLPVLENQKLAGMVSIGDLVKA